MVLRTPEGFTRVSANLRAGRSPGLGRRPAYVPARIDIVAMLRYYGAVNALEFALPGVLSWHLMPDGREWVEA